MVQCLSSAAVPDHRTEAGYDAGVTISPYVND